MRLFLRLRGATLVLCLLSIAVADVSAQSTLDLAARRLIRQSETMGKTSAQLHELNPDLALYGTDSPQAGVLIRVRPGTDASALEDAGFIRRAAAGDVLVGRAPISALRAIGETDGVISIEIGKIRELHNDEARADTRVDAVYTGENLPRAFRGEGAIVGIVDSGIDHTHPDFFDEDGSRILALGHYSSEEEFVAWTKADIDADPEAVAARDEVGHGTHVSGTAAGGGRVNDAYRGVAPEADLIVVGFEETISDDLILEAATWVAEQAEALGRPVVINMSLGGHDSPHDGTSNFERGMSALSAPGRILVAAAGNEGDASIHVGGELDGTFTTTTLPLGQALHFIGWHDPGAVEAIVLNTVELEGMEIVSADTFFVTTDVEAEGIVEVDGVVRGYYEMGAEVENANNGDGQFQIQIHNGGDENLDISYESGTAFGVTLLGETGGRFDIWQEGEGIFFDGEGVDTYSTVGSPATAEKVLSVGSYATRFSWTDADGVFQDAATQEDGAILLPGSLSIFSSLGPTRDGRVGVDVTAPGQMIASTVSSHAEVDPSYYLEGRLHGMEAGTSMASPHVAGIVALMLEANPKLDFDETLTILQQSARTDAFTGGSVPNISWGAGKVDAYEAVRLSIELATSTGRGELPAALRLLPGYPNPFNPATTFEFIMPQSGHARLAIYDVLGRQVRVLVDGQITAGLHKTRFDASGLSSGTYFVRLTSGSHSAVQVVTLTK